MRKRRAISELKNNRKRLKKQVIRKIVDTDEIGSESNINDGTETSSKGQRQDIIADESGGEYDPDDSTIDRNWTSDMSDPEYISDEDNIEEMLENLAVQEDELNECDNEHMDDDKFVADVDG